MMTIRKVDTSDHKVENREIYYEDILLLLLHHLSLPMTQSQAMGVLHTTSHIQHLNSIPHSPQCTKLPINILSTPQSTNLHTNCPPILPGCSPPQNKNIPVYFRPTILLHTNPLEDHPQLYSQIMRNILCIKILEIHKKSYYLLVQFSQQS